MSSAADTCLNGWPGVKPALAAIKMRTLTIPGTARRVTVLRSAAPAFAAFLADWHRLMPKRLNLNDGGASGCGGYNYRPARSGAGLSCHSGGVAVDCRWDILKADGKKHMTPAELKVLDQILATYVTTDGHRIFGSGAYWTTVDEMHTELSDHWEKGAKRRTTQADVDNVIKRLKIDKDGKRPLA